MFSSKFLSGANPLSAVSSAVNKFGLFGDDGEGDKKAPPQQAKKISGEQQPGGGPGKDSQQQQSFQKPGQGPSMQKSQPTSKQGPPQLHRDKQTEPKSKPVGQAQSSNTGTEPLPKQPKAPQQQGSAKPGGQQQAAAKSGIQAESTKVSPKPNMQQNTSKAGVQQKDSTKTGAQGETKVGAQVGQQQQTSSKVGPQKEGIRAAPQQPPSDKQHEVKRAGTPDLKSSGAATKARSQSKAQPRCPVCNTTELNVHSKEPPNHRTCTKCKSEVCSLCGFSPPDSDDQEWLCLTCQVQRAQGASLSPGPSTIKPLPNTVSAPQKQTEPARKGTSVPGSPQKVQSKTTNGPAKDGANKAPENPKHPSPAPAQKTTPNTQRKGGSQQPQQTSQTGLKQGGAAKAPPQESGGLFGFTGAKTEPPKAEDSMTGKMFGFGSSIFSSASTLIASAVQDEAKVTPPVSPKMQPTKETKPLTDQDSEQDRKQKQQAKSPTAVQSKSEMSTPEAAKMTVSHNASKGGQSTCPICNMVLNVGSKNPPNYNKCTECKGTVCNQCGFNPMPNVKEGKEWLCLNCQVRRAAGGTDPQKNPSMPLEVKKTEAQPSPQRTSIPGSPQTKLSMRETQAVKEEGSGSQKQTSPAPPKKTPLENHEKEPEKGRDQAVPTTQMKENVQSKSSGSLFGFGNVKNQTDATKPVESVTGKMFGFGNSIFSSASTLITSAVQDESKATPPVSPKMSPKKDSKSPTVKKKEPENKPQPSQQPTGPSQRLPKDGKPPSEKPKTTPDLPFVPKASQSTCPLCKVELNVGSNDSPNYNTCTECKNTVCNQCGFQPMPNVKEVKEWLCLNCQMQRALGASEPPGTPMMKLQASPNKVSAPTSSMKKETPPQQKDIPTSVKSKENSPIGSPQKRTPQQGQTNDSQKLPDQTSLAGSRKSSTASTSEHATGGLLNFGPKVVPDAAKSAEAVGGKMFGFGSSIFSSASTLLTSAVQDGSKTTPPVSPKMSAAKGVKTPPVQKHEQQKSTEELQRPKSSPVVQAKVEKGPLESLKDAAGQNPSQKSQSSCPLCKTELNLGSKDPPNYNQCTECKNTVCNQCGFNPMPNVSEVKEWLCLNCQMQRALSASEPSRPSLKPDTGVNKTSPSAVHKKILSPSPEESFKKQSPKSSIGKEAISPDPSQKRLNSAPGSPQITKSAAAPIASKDTKQLHEEPQASPIAGQKTSTDIQGKLGNQTPTKESHQLDLKPSKISPFAHAEEPRKPPVIGGQEFSKTTESISGKMFGFGSSIFSSASSLISAVQEDSRTTPPGSRKTSAPAQASAKISPKSTPPISPKSSPARGPKLTFQKAEQEKIQDEIHQNKKDTASSQPVTLGTVAQTSPDKGQNCCPLCKVKMNIGSNQPPNYNTCTECKNIVCNQCGFNPMPAGEIKEWLCLTCQMKRAVGPSEPPGPPSMKSQVSSNKVPVSTKVDAKEQKMSQSGETQLKKQSTSSGKTDLVAAPLKTQSPTLSQKTSQDKPKTAQEKLPDQASQQGRKQSIAPTETQTQSGRLVDSKPQPEAPKATESVSGKMLGFSSSIFSSASTLITSAVRDQPKTTPPVSPKMSPAKESKPPVAQKVEQQKKVESPLQAKSQPPVEPKADQTKFLASLEAEQKGKTKLSSDPKTLPSDHAKANETPAASPKPKSPIQASVKSDKSCPLCKIKLNIDSNDPPNYNTCTECKSTVCNQCGFNPMPNETEDKEWLCLTCQMQRAMGDTLSPGVAPVKPQISTKLITDSTDRSKVERKETSTPQSPQRKLSAAAQPPVTEVPNRPLVQKQASPASYPKNTKDTQKTPDPSKSPVQTRQSEHKLIATTAPQNL